MKLSRQFWKSFLRVSVNLTLLLTIACSAGKVERSPDKNFYVSFDSYRWEKIDTEKTDFLLRARRKSLLVYANSYCHQFQDDYLEVVSQRQLSGIAQLEILEKNSIKSHGREGIEIFSQGLIDGLKVMLYTKTIRKDHCLYDFTMVSPQKITEQDKRDFNRLVSKSRF